MPVRNAVFNYSSVNSVGNSYEGMKKMPAEKNTPAGDPKQCGGRNCENDTISVQTWSPGKIVAEDHT